MKNKIISAMLLSMSATMAVPGAAVYASEVQTDPAAVEEAAAETSLEIPEAPVEEATVEEAPQEEAQVESVDAPADVQVEPQENTEIAPLNLDAPITGDDTVTEAEKLAATPADFKEKLSSIEFSEEDFGKYAADLTEFAKSDLTDKSSLYNCEMSVIEKAENLAKGESSEAIKAMKYHIGLVFEKVYGEDAFLPGKDIRKAILSDSGKDADFSACTTIDDADKIYKDQNGVVAKPASLFKADDITAAPTAAPETEKELDTYVQGITDIEIQAGDEIPTANLYYDTEHISSVSVDTSRVDRNTVGVYTITYVIKGVNGTTKKVDKQCTVVENTELKNLRDYMCSKVDELGAGKFTEAEYKAKWDKAAAEAKSRINTMTNEQDMQQVVDAVTQTASSILSEQQLYVAKQGYVNIIQKYYATFSYETTAQKNMAEKAMKEAVDSINKATTVDEAAKALNEGKDKIRKIGVQDESTINEIRTAAKEEIKAAKNNVHDTTSITNNVYAVMIARLNTCKTAKEIDSTTNSAKLAFADAQKGVSGDMNSMFQLFKDLKGISKDSDTTAMIDQVIALGAPKGVDESEYKVCDICMALVKDKDTFIKYLSGRAGEDITAGSKSEAYEKYIEITNGNPKEDIEKMKTEAKKEIEKTLAAIEDTDDTVKEKKDKAKEEAFAVIDEAMNKDEMKDATEKAQEIINKLVEELQKDSELKAVKDAAKSQIETTVESQTEDKLKAAIQKLAEPALKTIEEAKTEEEVKTCLETFQKDVQTTIEAFEKDAKLAEAKANALKKLTELEADFKADYMTDDVKNIIKTARTGIEAAETEEDCNAIYAQAKEDSKNAYVTAMRNAYGAKLDALLTDNQFTDTVYLEKAKEIVTKQKENIAQASNEETMEKCYSLAKDSIDKLVAAQATAANLEQAKINAINTLVNGYPNPNDSVTKILNKYCNSINNATSADEIASLVEECKTVLSKAGVEYNPNNPNGSSTINGNGTNPGTNSNAATPNGSTTTTLPDGTVVTVTPAADASQKGTSDVSATGNVKTGDNNMGVIAISGAAIMAALSAAVISIKKFIHKDKN